MVGAEAHARDRLHAGGVIVVPSGTPRSPPRLDARGRHARTPLADQTASAAHASGLLQTALSNVPGRRVTPDRVRPLSRNNPSALPPAPILD